MDIAMRSSFHALCIRLSRASAMGLIVRLILTLGGSVASLFVAQGTANFPVVQAMFGILAVVILVVGFVTWRRRD
ncbi:hypothetical protein HMPREF9946_01673 [Acetobacteraceae bacterium AT-5844]|nr:hypothetical protein HMPREF9946_01673 [Acetobacteraceae bacterium AT-5844]